MIKVTEPHKDHALVKCGHAMVKAHRDHEKLVAALISAHEKFPEIEEQMLIALWVGVNAKDIDG